MKGGEIMKSVSFVTLVLIGLLFAAMIYLHVQATPIIREPHHALNLNSKTLVKLVSANTLLTLSNVQNSEHIQTMNPP